MREARHALLENCGNTSLEGVYVQFDFSPQYSPKIEEYSANTVEPSGMTAAILICLKLLDAGSLWGTQRKQC